MLHPALYALLIACLLGLFVAGWKLLQQRPQRDRSDRYDVRGR